MNKLRDYFLVPTNVTEELQEAMGDLEDLKKMVAELEKASQMHLGQSKRVQAHVDMMSKMEDTELDEAMYHHVLKGKVVASGSKSDMMKLVKKNGATIRKGPDTNYVLNSPGAKVGDIKEETLDEGRMKELAMKIAQVYSNMKKDKERQRNRKKEGKGREKY